MKRSEEAWFICEDALTYLPRRPLQEFAKDRIIYSPHQPSDSLFVVIQGRVRIISTAEDGCQTVARIVPTEGLFGESCLIGSLGHSETACALDKLSLMSWTRDEVERHIEREPRLGLALAQHMVSQCLDLQDRIESMAVHKTPERVMLALVQLAEALGVQMPDGSMRVDSLTHNTIAEYVGTSREIVTSQMNRLRRVGMVRYSRRHIDVYANALTQSLRQQGVVVRRPRAAGMAQAMAV